VRPLTTNQLFKDVFSAKVFAFQSDRSVDYTLAKSARGLNAEQKEALANAIEAPLPHLYNVRQVHGDRIVFASNNDAGGAQLEEADGILTDEKELAILVRTADCLPVFVHDPAHGAIGLFHCGWRSTHKQILKKALALMAKYYQSDPAKLKVAFGPALRLCHYEVGPEFLEHFPGSVEKRDGKLYFDLAKANKDQLTAAGVKKEHIHDGEICTFCDTAYFSHRREKEKAGRMLSFMMLKN
jgi:YfiH family protein